MHLHASILPAASLLSGCHITLSGVLRAMHYFNASFQPLILPLPPSATTLRGRLHVFINSTSCFAVGLLLCIHCFLWDHTENKQMSTLHTSKGDPKGRRMKLGPKGQERKDAVPLFLDQYIVVSVWVSNYRPLASQVSGLSPQTLIIWSSV